MRPRGHHMLAPGTVLRVLQRAGISIETGDRPKIPISCPLPGHEDDDPSAFVDSGRNIFYCSPCTRGKGWSAKRLAKEFGVLFSDN